MANFWRRGTSKAFFAPTVTLAAPTAVQVNAGTDLTPKIADVAGFTFTNQAIATPDWATTLNTQIPGEDQLAASALTFYEDKTSNPIRTALAKGTVGYIVIFFAGIAGSTPAAGDKCEVWPAIVAAVPRLYTFGTEAAKWRADLTPNAAPNTDAVLV